MVIAHLADLHVRQKTRHEEYEHVLGNLVERLNIIKPDIIALVGDIFHSKTELTPECISVVSKYLISLSNIAKVVLVAGNHDANLSNSKRMDSLSPVVSLLKKNGHNIEYYKKTGIYEIADGYNLCVFSVLDGKDIPSVNEEDVNIALYHGPVSGARLDTGFVFDDNSMHLSSFGEFDYVMLGDIHKRQFLGTKTSKRIAYCGSLIQQDFAEDLDKGFLLWDIRGKDDFDVEFVKIDNDYGFVTIDETLPDIQGIKYPNIRCVIDADKNEMHVSDLADIGARIQEKYSPSSYRIDLKSSSGNDKPLDKMAVPKEKVEQATILREWLENKGYEKGIVDKVLELDMQVHDCVASSYYKESLGSCWKIKEVTLKNFMSYKNETTINFEKYGGIIGLFGNNASGKSAIIDAILYALFNKTTREVKNDKLISRSADVNECLVKLVIEIDNETYVITRSTKRNIKKSTKEITGSSTDLDLSMIKDGSEQTLNEELKRNTEKVIRAAVGTYDEFLSTTLSVQDGGIEFIRMKPAARMDGLVKYLGLGIFQVKHEYAKDMCKQLTAERKALSAKFDEKEIGDLRSEQTALGGEVLKETKRADEYRSENDEIRKKILEHKEELNTSVKSDQNFGDIEAEIEKANADVVVLEEEKESLIKRVAKLKSGILQVSNKYVLSEEDMLKLSDNSKLISKLSKQIGENDSAIKAGKRSLKFLTTDIQSSNKCPVSYDENSRGCAFLSSISEKRKECGKILEECKRFEEENETMQKTIDGISYADKALANQRFVEGKLYDASSRLREMENRILVIDGKIEVKNISLRLLRKNLKIATENAEAIRSNKMHRESIDVLEGSLLVGERALADVEKWLGSSEKRMAVIKDRLASSEKALSELKDLEENLEHAEVYKMAMHRDGLPSELLKHQLGRVNFEINELLLNVVGFKVNLEMNDNEDEVEITLNYGDSDHRPAQMASGMEKLVTNMAIRNSLLKVGSENTPRFWIIDEGFSVLDGDNMASVRGFFNTIRNRFDNILLITHIDALKDVADWVYTIERNGESSMVSGPFKNI